MEFYINGKEYDYEIEKSTGKILSFDYDMESDIPTTNPGNTGSNVISEQEARDLALARVPGATASHIRIEFDNDDGRLTYEGEIRYENKEYEFEIDASTGKFIAVSYTHLSQNKLFVSLPLFQAGEIAPLQRGGNQRTRALFASFDFRNT